MKTQAECWQALLDGKTLMGADKHSKLTMKNGWLVNVESETRSGFSLSCPEDWSIKPETKMITKEQLLKAVDHIHHCSFGLDREQKKESLWSRL